MLDAHIWMLTDCGTCALRRHSRGKKRKRTELAEFQQWYEQHVWPRFEQYQTVQLANARGALVLDGAQSRADIAKAASGHMEELLKRGLDEADRFASAPESHQSPTRASPERVSERERECVVSEVGE